ncbi:TPA: hypothetical protein ACGF16_003492, partial [Vibrio cholerae]
MFHTFGGHFCISTSQLGNILPKNNTSLPDRAKSYPKEKIVIETSGKYKTIHFCVSSSFKVNI